MQVSGTAVHVYDTPLRHSTPRVETPWGKIVAVLAMFMLVGVFAYAIFGILVQRL